MAVILPCGRIAEDVDVGGAIISLIVDTGAEASAIPLHAVPAALHAAPVYRPVTFIVAGTRVLTYKKRGVTADTTVSSHDRATTSTVTSGDIRVHLLPAGTSPFISFGGLLGMDMLDDFDADPAKDRAGTVAYLASRV